MAHPPIVLPAGLSWFEEPLPGVAVDIETASARVLLQGAQLLDWTPRGADPVLWVSEVNTYQPGVGIVGGVPICFPWFGRGRANDQDQLHGWAQLVEWTLTNTQVGDGQAHLTFALDTAARATSAALAGATLEYRVTIGTELRLELAITAGVAAVDVEADLHTYLAIDSVGSTHVTGLDQASYWDKDTDLRARQRGPVVLADGVDRVYDGTGTEGVVAVVGADRTISVHAAGATKTVVWNPGARGQDYGAHTEQMVCVESGCVRDQPIVLAPGERHVMSASYSLE